MANEGEYLDGGGLGTLWARCKAYFLAKSGGTLTGKLTISAGGIEVSGGSSAFHSSIYFDQGFGVASTDDNNESVSLLSYSTGNIAAIAYGNASKGVTRIFGKSLVLYTNGWNARMTIGEDGVTTLANKLTISSGGLEVTGDSRYHDSVVFDNTKGLVFKNTSDGNVTALSLNSQDVLVIGYGNASANQTQIFGKSIILCTNGSNTRVTIGEDGNVKFEGSVSIKSGNEYKGVWHAGNSNLATVDWAAKDLSAAGTLNVTGVTTLASTLNVSGLTTLMRTASPLVLKNGNTSGNQRNHVGIHFLANDDTDLGYIGVRKYSSRIYPYYYDSDYHELWHTGNFDASAIAAAIGQMSATTQEHSVILASQDARVTDLESYFNGDIPKKAVSALSLSGVTINYSIGGVAQTGLTLPDASASASGVVSTGTQTFAGAKTFNGTTLFANNVTIKKSSSATTPLTIATSASTGDNANRAAIEFEKNDGTALGYIGCRIVNNVKEPYFNGGDYHTIWHKGIAGTSTTDWACKNLTASGDVSASGDIYATGGVAAGGIADLSIIQ